MRYIARRLMFYLAAGWAAVTLNFLIPRLMPGNPVQILISRFPGQLSGTATRALTAAFGLAADPAQARSVLRAAGYTNPSHRTTRWSSFTCVRPADWGRDQLGSGTQ